MGTGSDGIKKTPEWAQPITGIPSDVILKLAREEIGDAKRIYITQGWGCNVQQMVSKRVKRS